MREIKAHLMAEDRNRARAGAVGLFGTVRQRMFHQFEILPHPSAPGRDSRPDRKLSAGPGPNEMTDFLYRSASEKARTDP
jgi:hypothetical protein